MAYNTVGGKMQKEKIKWFLFELSCVLISSLINSITKSHLEVTGYTFGANCGTYCHTVFQFLLTDTIYYFTTDSILVYYVSHLFHPLQKWSFTDICISQASILWLLKSESLTFSFTAE